MEYHVGFQIGGFGFCGGGFQPGLKERTARLCISGFGLWRNGIACRFGTADSAGGGLASQSGNDDARPGRRLFAAGARHFPRFPIGSGSLPGGRDGNRSHSCGTLRADSGTSAGIAAFAGIARLLCGVFAVIVLLICCCLPVRAQEIPEEAQQILTDDSSLPQEVGQWELEDLFDWLAGLVGEEWKAPIRFGLQAGGYLLLSGVLGLLAGGASWRRLLDTLAVLGFGALSLHAMMSLTDTVVTSAQDCQNYLMAFVPVFSGVAAVGGQTVGAMVYSGMFFAMSGFLAAMIKAVVLPIMQIYFCFASCACIWGNTGIEEAAALFSKCLHGLLKVCGILFGLVLGVQNVLAGTVDTAALRTGKSALQGFIPVVGDAAAAALSGAASAVQLLKGSLALAALMALAAVFVPVFIHCLLYTAAFAGAGIAASGTGQKQCAQLCRLYYEGTKLCASVLILYFFMVFLSTALLLISGSGG